MPIAREEVALLNSMMGRADKLLDELRTTYERDLVAQSVSLEAMNLTHEVVEKCANILDQAMTALFEYTIKPLLSELPKRGGYFPAAETEHAYRSALGQWKATNLDVLAPEVDKKLRSLQPFTDRRNAIFVRVRGLASAKHTGLKPQIKYVQRRVNITGSGGGSVSWGRGVTFGAGVSVMGVPINPTTQMPAHSRGIDVSFENWVSFHFKDGGEDALNFCKASIDNVRRAVSTLIN